MRNSLAAKGFHSGANPSDLLRPKSFAGMFAACMNQVGVRADMGLDRDTRAQSASVLAPTNPQSSLMPPRDAFQVGVQLLRAKAPKAMVLTKQ